MVQDLVESNIDKNNMAIAAAGGQASFAELAWGETAIDTLQLSRTTLAIAADVIYHQELFEPLCSTFQALGTCLD